MLIRLLSDRGFPALLLTVILAVGLMVFGFLTTDADASHNELMISHWAFGRLYGRPTWSLITGLICIVSSGVLIRMRTQVQRLLLPSGNSALLIWLAVLFSQRDLLLRPDVLSANLAIMAMFILLFSAHDRDRVLSRMFHVGMLLGAAFVLVGQTALFGVAVCFSLLILRPGNWREWLVPVLGMTMVAVFICLFLVWRDDPISEFRDLMYSSWTVPMTMADVTVAHLLFSVVLLLTLPHAVQSLTTGSVAERNHLLSLLGWITVSMLCVPLLGLGWQNGVVFAAFPMSVFVARSLSAMNRWWLADLLLVAALAAPFLSNLSPF